jgi:hypothetical protein
MHSPSRRFSNFGKGFLLFRSRAITAMSAIHPPVIPTDPGRSEGDVRLSGGIPALSPAPCGTREFYQNNFTCPCQRASLSTDSLPHDLPSRTPRAPADTKQYLRIALDLVHFCGRTGAGEGTAPLQIRVSPLQFFPCTTTNRQIAESISRTQLPFPFTTMNRGLIKSRTPKHSVPEARRQVSPP